MSKAFGTQRSQVQILSHRLLGRGAGILEIIRVSVFFYSLRECVAVIAHLLPNTARKVNENTGVCIKKWNT